MAVAFALLLLASALLASRLTAELGVAHPEREVFALIQAIMFAASLSAAVPLSGQLLGEGRWAWPGLLTVLAFALAAVASYLIFADNRSGSYFDTDHAVPEIFVPSGIALLASAGIGRRSATTDPSRRAWSRAGVGAGLVFLVLIAMTLTKVAAGSGGMYRLDSPLTFGSLVLAGVYGLVGVLRLPRISGGT